MRIKINELRERANQLEKLIAEFPDLGERNLRWETVMVSKVVNASPEKVILRYSCGCCDDALLEAGFFVERYNERIYADPPFVCIGEKGYDGDTWYDDWGDIVLKTYGDAAFMILQSTRGEAANDRSDGEGHRS